MSDARPAPPAGILVVDKPAGCTSHDVVAWARRALRTREVGHAGTLDPAATGVLVLLLGDGTRLSAFVTADEKSYEATVRFGEETDSLDADGAVIATGPAEVSTEALRDALGAMVGPMSQVPPVVSAVKVDGVASHARARRGEAVALAAREVVLCEAALLAHEGNDARISLRCSKGFYVRALARDLAARLGTVAHLVALRRTRSGSFTVEESVSGERLRAARDDDEAQAAVRAGVIPLEALEGRVASLRVPLDAARNLRCGRATPAPEGTAAGVFLALLAPSTEHPATRALGLVRCTDGVLRVERNLPDTSLLDLAGNTSAPAELV
jgi:tRNA pseudouridine55 synthase